MKNTWLKNKRLTQVLILIWFITTLLVGLSPDILRFSFFGWEFTYF